MQFSILELQKLANLDSSITTLKMADALTKIGFEVENITPFGDVANLKFGKIKKIAINPKQSNLHICHVQFADKMRIIQTNAANVFVDMIVIACVPGSRLGKKEIASREIQGVVSEGMLTNHAEFGINSNLIRPEWADKITHYQDVKDLTLDPITYLGLNDDLLEINILPNRSDAASYYVLALELSAYFGTKVNLPQLKNAPTKASVSVAKNAQANLTLIEAETDFDISIKEQIFLAKHGIKAINKGADLSNLTLLYSGQPTHCYDRAQLGNNFDLKLAKGPVTLIGDQKVTLDKVLTVQVDNQIQSVASVIGLKDSATSFKTKNIVIELGRFDNMQVRHSQKQLKMTTMASLQGSKEIASGTTKLALSYLSSKLKTYSQFVNWKEPALKSITFDEPLVDQFAGFTLSKTSKYQKVWAQLTKLGFKLENDKVTIPAYRHDLATMQDIIEEIFRFYGYENFQPTQPALINKAVQETNDLKKSLITQGYQEVRTYTLISQKANIFNPFNFEHDVKLATYVSQAREVIRNSQTFSLWEIMEYNFKRKVADLAIVSQGIINNGIETIAWATNIKSFRDVQKDLLALNHDLSFISWKNPEYHPGISAQIMKNNKIIGWIAQLHPRHSKQPVIYAEVKQSALANNKIIKFIPYEGKRLKQEDITFSLGHQEMIGPHLKTIKALQMKVIDEYDDQANQLTKVTVRLTKEEKDE